MCRHIITNLVHHNKWVIFEGEITENHHAVEAKIPVNIRLLLNTEADVDKLSEFWPDTYALPLNTAQSTRQLITRLLEDGEECLIAEYEGKIVHMNWLGYYDSHRYVSHEKKRMIKPGEALSYNTYCSEDYRGNSLMGAVHTEAFNLLASRGFHKYIGYVEPHNHASMKVSTQFCGKPKGIVSAWKILGYSLNFFSRKQA